MTNAAIKMAKAKAEKNTEAPIVKDCPAFDKSADIMIGHADLVELIDVQRELENLAEVPRGHLGMSQIGKEDERELWLDFRWCLPRNHPAKLLRIFDLGHILEAELIARLRSVTVGAQRLAGVPCDGNKSESAPAFQLFDRDPTTGKQFRFSDYGGHFSGSMDAVIQGIPESKAWHVLDIKTCNAKKFAEFVKKGTKEVAPHYYAQAICYMAKADIDRAVFIYYNKDTSELYFDRMKADRFEWQKYKDRAERILTASEPPESDKKETDYQLRWHDDQWQRIYWSKELPPRAHCRNCRHAAPILEGESADWFCSRHESKIGDTAAQWKGCKAHQFLPSLVALEFVQHHGPDVTQYKLRDGSDIYNVIDDPAFKDAKTFTSKEMIALSKSDFDPALIDDPNLAFLRDELGGRIHDTQPSAHK